MFDITPSPKTFYYLSESSTNYTMWRACESALGASMLIVILMDLWRLYLGPVSDKVPDVHRLW